MLPPVVVIQLEPEPDVAAASVLSERCTAVVASSGSGGCALAGDQNAQRADWVVQVRWSGTPLEMAEIVLSHRPRRDAPIRKRELRFTEQSPELDRWESVGLLTAALVVSARAEPEGQAPPPPPASDAPTPQDVTPEATGTETGSHLRWALGLLAASNREGSTEWGATLQGQIAIAHVPVQPLCQLGFSRGGGTPELNTGALSLGVGVPLVEGPVELQLYAQVLGQLVRAHAEADGVTESQLVGRVGGSAGVAAYPRLATTWSLWLAAEASVLTPRVTFEVLDRQAGELGPLGFRGFLGLRYSP